MFRDEMVFGPFSNSEHTHLFLHDPDDPVSSWLEDRIQYELRSGRLEKIVAGKWTRRSLKHRLTRRREVTIQESIEPAKRRG